MTAPAAITAQLVDVRNVSSHRCVRLELHVPAEQAGLVMAAFGWPTMADPVPVALARLTAAPESVRAKTAQTEKERRPFSELPYSQQAAMRCQEADFISFVRADSSEGAANRVRAHCGVASRSDIVKGTNAGDAWQLLDAEFYAHSRGMR